VKLIIIIQNNNSLYLLCNTFWSFLWILFIDTASTFSPLYESRA